MHAEQRPTSLGVPAGEAQKIDRIMERFAERYCKDNPYVFKTSDGAYLLSFALIMLNTDAHNPMADKKLSLDDFVSMCQYQVLFYCSLLSLYKTKPCMPKVELRRVPKARQSLELFYVRRLSREGKAACNQWGDAMCLLDH